MERNNHLGSGAVKNVSGSGDYFDSEGNYAGPVVVIVGPTGSGKTGVSIEIAKKINGEIISADSRAIYKGMDIGTAKPTLAERDGVPHFGFDLVEPGERFTAADFKVYAEEKIAEIRKRGHVPIIAGGTGLYVDALVYDYKFGEAPDTRSAINNYHRHDNYDAQNDDTQYNVRRQLPVSEKRKAESEDRRAVNKDKKDTVQNRASAAENDDHSENEIQRERRNSDKKTVNICAQRDVFLSLAFFFYAFFFHRLFLDFFFHYDPLFHRTFSSVYFYIVSYYMIDCQ